MIHIVKISYNTKHNGGNLGNRNKSNNNNQRKIIINQLCTHLTFGNNKIHAEWLLQLTENQSYSTFIGKLASK